MRITAGANPWGEVEAVMEDRCILWQSVTMEYMNALETMVLTKKQHEKVQVCKKTKKNRKS